MRALTIRDCARELAVDETTVWRRIIRGELPAYRIGRAFRVDPRAWADFKTRLKYAPTAPTFTTPTDSRLIDRARRAH